MLEHMNSAPTRLVGVRQVTKAIRLGNVKCVVMATDADIVIQTEIETLCKRHDVKLEKVTSMRSLGKACGIEVGASVAALLSDE